MIIESYYVKKEDEFMLKSKLSQKVLAGILVFTLTFANFAFTTEALATSFFDTFFRWVEAFTWTETAQIVAKKLLQQLVP